MTDSFLEKLNDLVESLNISNVEWNAWERSFIEDIAEKDFRILSDRQKDKVLELWDKI